MGIDPVESFSIKSRSAGRKLSSASDCGGRHSIRSNTRFSIFAALASAAKKNSAIGSLISTYLCCVRYISEPIRAETPNSSCNSRASASCCVSPGLIFPPGNSHISPKDDPCRRWHTRSVPLDSISAATTVSIKGFFPSSSRWMFRVNCPEERPGSLDEGRPRRVEPFVPNRNYGPSVPPVWR